jgi:hypothetical protein
MTCFVRFAGAIVVLLVMGAVTPASAQEGFWWWLERLSGPGAYHGWGATWTAVCVGTRKDSRTADDRDVAAADTRIYVDDPGCGTLARNQPRATLRFQVAFAGADGNPLQYDPPRSGDDLHTRVFALIPAVDFGVTPWLEAGAGIGLVRFTGDAFDGFSKPAIQLIRLTGKPLRFYPTDDPRKRYGLEFLQIRYVATLIPDGFDAQEFGAVPGTFSTGTEFLSSFSIVIDPFSLVALLRR